MNEVQEMESLVARMEREFEPVRKKYRTFNTGNPTLSWESIQTQAIYRRMRRELSYAKIRLGRLRKRKKIK